MVKIAPDRRAVADQPLQSLSVGDVIGLPAAGFSSGEAMRLMEEIAAQTLPPGGGYEWTAMSYQEKVVGNQMYFVFALALLLVYLVLAGQYESWFAPISVILAVPLALLGPVWCFSRCASTTISISRSASSCSSRSRRRTPS